jgi:DNA-binding HxlR family transcriptional regulator
MPTSRSYGDACGIARALDIVGERWALLVVRELLLGPLRFSDLARALPGASSNMLTDRLRELEARGVLCRRTLPPPAGSAVYELTARGRALEPVLDAIGSWGAAEPRPAGSTLSVTSVLLFLRGSAQAHRSPPPGSYRIALEDRVFTYASPGGRPEITPGEPPDPDARLETDPETLNALLADPDGLGVAIASGVARTGGSIRALRRLLGVAA